MKIPRIKNKLASNRGIAILLTTVVVLILATMILIFAYQESAMTLLVNKNVFDKHTAVKSARACDQRKVLEAGLGGGKITSPVEIIGNPAVPNVNCQTVSIVYMGKYQKPGSSANMSVNRVRYTTTGTGFRFSQAQIISDVLTP